MLTAQDLQAIGQLLDEKVPAIINRMVPDIVNDIVNKAIDERVPAIIKNLVPGLVRPLIDQAVAGLEGRMGTAMSDLEGRTDTKFDAVYEWLEEINNKMITRYDLERFEVSLIEKLDRRYVRLPQPAAAV